MNTNELFGTQPIGRILWKLAPPVMLAQLIQALYNIIDSLFIGHYAASGLTALSIIYPLQLLMIALAVGTGVGINTVMAAELGIAGAAVATVTGQVVAAVVVARKALCPPPALAVFPGHIARIFRLGLPNILMQSAYTVYILGLNLILAGFSDQAVTALGLYYKWQTFFFIPLGAMQTCIVPVISFNYAARKIARCRQTLVTAVGFGLALMAVGAFFFLVFPAPMLQVFTADERVVDIGRVGFRFIGVSFFPLVTSLIFPVFFQAVGYSLKSSLLTVIRTVVLFVPLGYLFSRWGLTWFWLTFPVTETVTSLVGFWFYRQFLAQDYVTEAAPAAPAPVLQTSRPGVILTIDRQHGSGGKQIGKLVAQKLEVPFYYKEMIALAAQESGLDRQFLSDLHKNTPDVLRQLYLSSKVVQYAVQAQAAILHKLADQGSCVIVGRAVWYVLRDHPDVVRVFVHAPRPYRLHRLEEIYGDSPAEARRNLQRSDSARASYYHHISGRRWGDARDYALTVDAPIGPEAAADLIVHYLHSRPSAP